MGHFVEELKRRNVIRVAIAYAVVAWLSIEISATTFPMLRLPEWAATLVTVLLMIGFPVALIFAWAFELTPEGLKKEKDVDRSQSITHITGRKLDFFIIAGLSLALVFVVIDQYVLDRKLDEFASSETTDQTVPVYVETAELERSIAVLPFRNRSAVAEDAYFVDGIHDDILTQLSKLSSLKKVVSRTSMEQYRDTTKPMPRIGQELDVATILEGGVQRAGGRVRITVQLIDAAADEHLWATTYDRELTAENVFEVQSEIARMIVDSLDAELSANDKALLSTVPTENTEALILFLQARQLSKRHSFEALRQADRYFREATELDPEYVRAWAAIADNRSKMLATGLIDVQEYIAAAEPAITRALELDDRLPEAHAQLARLHWSSGDLEAAEASIRKALELNPGDSSSLIAYGQYLRRTGRPLEAIPVLERALKNDPLSVQILYELGDSEMRAGRPEQNVKYAQRILEIDPSSLGGYTSLWQAYMWMGRFDLLWRPYIKTMALDPEDFEFPAILGLFASMLGAPEWADRYLDHALALGQEESTTLMSYALVLVQRGKSDEALAIARRALEAGADDRWHSNQTFLRLVRDNALQTGNFDDVLAWYRNRHPELFGGKPEIRVRNVNAAADLAMLLQRAGDSEAADVLIDAGLVWYRETQRPGVHGYHTNIADVEFLALNADKKAALNALREAVDGGWRWTWQWYMSNENLDSLRNEPEFQAIIERLEDDMATQLEAIREIPYLGEFDLRAAQSD